MAIYQERAPTHVKIFGSRHFPGRRASEMLHPQARSSIRVPPFIVDRRFLRQVDPETGYVE
jgi:hypothetical protein